MEEEGIREEVEAVATKRVLAWQLQQAREQQEIVQKAMPHEPQTSLAQTRGKLDC